MSAPIGRVRITTEQGRKGSSARWRPAEAPIEVDTHDAPEAEVQSPRPPFYPFAPRTIDESDR